MSEVTNGGTSQNERSPKGQNNKREFCPQLATLNDLVAKIGSLSVDILNKEKVLTELWNNIDFISNQMQTQNKEIESLRDTNLQQENAIAAKAGRVAALEASKEKVRENQVRVEEKYKSEIKELEDKHSLEVNKLEKVLKAIEGEAVINQEEIRQELMESRNELSSLKESLKPTKKVRKKKKTNAKPARA